MYVRENTKTVLNVSEEPQQHLPHGSAHPFPLQEQHHEGRNTLHTIDCNQWSIQYFLPVSKWLKFLSTSTCCLCSKLHVRKGHSKSFWGLQFSWRGRGENTLFPKMKGLHCCFSLLFKFSYSITFYNVILFYCFPLLTTDTKSFLNANFLCVLCNTFKLQIPVDNEDYLAC